jgi:hypothetical protein
MEEKIGSIALAMIEAAARQHPFNRCGREDVGTTSPTTTGGCEPPLPPIGVASTPSENEGGIWLLRRFVWLPLLDASNTSSSIPTRGTRHCDV